MTTAPTPWLLGLPDLDPAKERLFCFPHAGAGASVFAPWRANLPESVGLFPVQLPGRENRFGDPMPDTLEELTEQTAQALLPLLRPPYVLFGHSFGGLLAFALARHLHDLGHPLPRVLLISGARPPHLPAGTALHALPHDRLLDHLRATNGVPEPLMQHEEFVRRLLHVVRTDLRVAAGFRPGRTTPLPCDTRVFAAADDPVVPPAVMQDWRDYVGGRFGVHQGPGDHYAVYDPTGGLFTTIVRSGLSPS
ncbi:medium-chain acyl-[acyl-carrier-protein] hydrolase [Streptacidiphilus sp. MAP12-33]|uniref:thioesterase II family protein n=1 Tax=Streptacidiphilus sp. MAP12-33 TaxID=3156266 RepID=UPI0035135D45